MQQNVIVAMHKTAISRSFCYHCLKDIFHLAKTETGNQSYQEVVFHPYLSNIADNKCCANKQNIKPIKATK